jgi:hypothetical protein
MCREIILPVTDYFFLPFIDYLFPYTKLDFDLSFLAIKFSCQIRHRCKLDVINITHEIKLFGMFIAMLRNVKFFYPSCVWFFNGLIRINKHHQKIHYRY